MTELLLGALATPPGPGLYLYKKLADVPFEQPATEPHWALEYVDADKRRIRLAHRTTFALESAGRRRNLTSESPSPAGLDEAMRRVALASPTYDFEAETAVIPHTNMVLNGTTDPRDVPELRSSVSEPDHVWIMCPVEARSVWPILETDVLYALVVPENYGPWNQVLKLTYSTAAYDAMCAACPNSHSNYSHYQRLHTFEAQWDIEPVERERPQEPVNSARHEHARLCALLAGIEHVRMFNEIHATAEIIRASQARANGWYRSHLFSAPLDFQNVYWASRNVLEGRFQPVSAGELAAETAAKMAPSAEAPPTRSHRPQRPFTLDDFLDRIRPHSTGWLQPWNSGEAAGELAYMRRYYTGVENFFNQGSYRVLVSLLQPGFTRELAKLSPWRLPPEASIEAYLDATVTTFQGALARMLAEEAAPEHEPVVVENELPDIKDACVIQSMIDRAMERLRGEFLQHNAE